MTPPLGSPDGAGRPDERAAGRRISGDNSMESTPNEPPRAKSGWSDAPITVEAAASDDRDDNGSVISPVVHVDDPVTRSAFERVVRDKLQERYDLLLVALCTHAMSGIVIGMRGLQLANKRSLFRPLEGVAIRIGFKALGAMLFLSQIQHRVLHRELLRLQRDQSFKKLGDETVGRLGVGVRFSEESSEILGNIRRCFGHSGSIVADTDEGSDGL